jgi:hypothetical protein
MTRCNHNAYSVALLSLAAFLVFGALPLASKADAPRQEFSEQSIEGRWGFSGDFGMIVPPSAPQPVPTAALSAAPAGHGTVVFDGKGGCVVTTTINANGTIIGPLASNTCTYSVNPDGTGKSVAEFSGAPFNGPSTVTFVIVDHNREIRFLNTNSVVAGFTARRQ